MNRHVVYLITFIVCILLQILIAPAIAIAGCSPNFLLIPVLLVALRSGATPGAIAGFCCGLLFDFVGNGTIGCMALTFTVLAFIVATLAAAIEVKTPVSLCAVAVCSALFVELLYAFVSILASAAGGSPASLLFNYVLPGTLYSSVFACIAIVTTGLVIGDDGPNMPGISSTPSLSSFKIK